MSRIHDLLNRAEQEKELLRVVDLERESVALPVAVGGSAKSRASHEIGSSTALTFDDLLTFCPRGAWMLDPASNVFSGTKHEPAAAEEFRGIRSRLYRLREARQLKTILVTSPVPKEGKSFVACNLAHALAIQPDCRVLLIDANLRNPALHRFFSTLLTPGLSDYLLKPGDPISIVQRGENDNLILIAAGSAVAGPAELLSNGQLASLIKLVAPAFDWILIDSPPAIPFTDAALLANQCEGVLMVVRSNSTPLEVARQARRKFREGHIAGVVLNGAAAPQNYAEIH